MNIHAVNCASFHPVTGAPARHADGRGYLSTRCLILEGDDGVIVVDTGFGVDDIARPVQRLGRPFLLLARPRLDPVETLLARLRARNIAPEDVTDVLITHLDLDHSGGLEALPHARVHVHALELATAQARARSTHRLRYVAEHWAHAPRWQPFTFGGERVLGDAFPAWTPEGLPPAVRFVGLPGHTAGHCGVMVERADGTRLLHAGDAFMETREIVDAGHRPTLATRAHHAIFDDNPAVARATRRALREAVAAHGEGLSVVNAHDPHMRTAEGTVVLEPGLDARG